MRIRKLQIDIDGQDMSVAVEDTEAECLQRRRGPCLSVRQHSHFKLLVADLSISAVPPDDQCCRRVLFAQVSGCNKCHIGTFKLQTVQTEL